ncbi:MAG: peptidoglycan-binding protein [Pedobacter sp.]|nr:peptidoglycan-binding protein [Pedobacter sp.]
MATIRMLFGVLCLAAVGSYRMPHRNLLGADEQQRVRLLNIARTQIGVRERTGQNDGEQVERYLATTGLKKGQPWCAAFISWVFKEGGYNAPRTAWSPALFNTRVNTKKPETCNIFGIWFPELKRIAHVGLIEKREGDWLISIEGNTNVPGSREGDGVYRKRRPFKNIYLISDWLKGKELSDE